jgi:hypothetical protein
MNTFTAYIFMVFFHPSHNAQNKSNKQARKGFDMVLKLNKLNTPLILFVKCGNHSSYNQTSKKIIQPKVQTYTHMSNNPQFQNNQT